MPTSLSLPDVDFPTDFEIREAVQLYVAKQHNYIWPDDDWFRLSDNWEVNVWRRGPGEKRATVYLSNAFELVTTAGISFFFD